MLHLRLIHALSLALTLGLSGCLGGKIEHPGALALHALPVDSNPTLPPKFLDTLGFDNHRERGERPDPRIGDAVLYRAHFSDGKETHDWYVRMTLVRSSDRQVTMQSTFKDGTKETRTSPLWEAEVEVYDCAAETNVVTTMGIAQSSMTHSIFRQSELLYPLMENGGELSSLSKEDRESYVLGAAAISNLFNGWQNNEELQPLLKKVIGFPTRAVLGMLLRGSLSYTIAQELAPDSAMTAELPDPIGTLPAERVPISITMGGVTLMHVDLITVDTLGALGIGFGLTALRGAHPSDESRWIDIQLIGARSGRSR